MNRHERRKKAAQARRGRSDTMGAGYSSGPLPAHVTSHPAFQEGERVSKGGAPGEMTEGYYKAIEDAARLMGEWVRAQPTMPELRWLAEKDDGTFIAAALDAGAEYLADSPDAFRMLAWLDEKTGRQLSINKARWALRLCRALPMPDGSYHGVETVRESEAMRNIKALLSDAKTTRFAGSPCGHCGKALDAASSDTGQPAPGNLSICVVCLGINRFDDALRNVAVTDEELAALPADVRSTLEEMQAIMRRSRMAERKGPAAEA
jgi:hypothetical protein